MPHSEHPSTPVAAPATTAGDPAPQPTRPSQPAQTPQTSRARWTRLLPGLALVVPIAVVAMLIGRAFPVVGGPVSGVLLGGVTASLLRPVRRAPRLAAGVKFAGGRVLQAAVVLLGAQVSIPQVLRSGWHSLPVMLGTLTVCLSVAWGVGRLLRIDRDLTTLVGVGTAICGASAIAAVTPVVKPAAGKVAYALSTIFLFNILAVLLFPWVGHALGMSQEAFGVFAGTAVNDTSSVVAAAATYGREATDVAVVVKLTRTLMIIPIVLGLAYLQARRSARISPAANTAGPADNTADNTAVPAPRRPGLFTLVPWFLIGFLVLATVNSILPLPPTAADVLITASVFLITMALTAIGLSTDVAGLRRTGPAPLLLGFVLWLSVTATSLLIQAATTGLT
ncbi:putative sulfate exporter family transporter [Pseudactinotalea sp. HY160]|uniref:YeiH family protein n=1 Tax=Pseudactinotalea sp. HY160 TaxID=2654490 RepID=UPI00128C6AC8|nr:YeiH family protein [Pseudactinotalea sp. HY160]MPV48669.1 putative sulfate exporter family transporter [Pseudactinotalea sp. HY160]